MCAVSSRTCAVAAVAALAILAGIVPAVGVAPAVSGTDTRPAAASPPGLGQIDFDPSETTIQVSLQEDGSARWNVSYKLDLATENDTAAFRELRADVDENTSLYLDDFTAGIDATVTDASSATGREMTAENYTVATGLDSIQNVGYVTYGFTWTNFAEESGSKLVAGDALAGFFLEGSTTLRMSWPEGYSIQSVQPPGDESQQSVSWSGEETTFGQSGPRLVVTSGGGGLPLPLIAGGLLVGIAAVGVVVLSLRRRKETGADAPDAPTEPEPAERSSDSGPAEAAAASAAEEGAPEETAAEEPPAELLSNEERVLRLLEEHGGRVKQQAVVSEFDWTAAKTSQVITEMHEDGQIEKFRLGRENVLKLPEEDDGGDES